MEAYKLCPNCRIVVSFNTYFGAYICNRCDWVDDSYNIRRAKGLLDMKNITCSSCGSILEINEKGSVVFCRGCVANLKIKDISLKDILIVTSDVLTKQETDELKVEFKKAIKNRGKKTHLITANYMINLKNLTDEELEDMGLKRKDKK